MRARLMHPGPVLMLLALLALGCADEPAARMRIAIQTLPGDGAPPAPLWLSSLDARKGDARIPLVATGREGADLYLYEADAPAGSYRVENDAGWGTLSSGQTPAMFHAEPTGAPNLVALAKPRTLYLRPRTADRWRVLPQVALERFVEGDPGTWERVSAAVQEQPGGWLLVRLPDEVLQPGVQLRASAIFEGNVPTATVTFVMPKDVDVPFVRLLDPAAGLPMSVELVGGEVPDELAIEARLLSHPLEITWVSRILRGRTWFEGLGEHVEGIEVLIPAWGPDAKWRVDEPAWTAEQALFPLVVSPSTEPRRVRLPALPDAAAPRRVLLRAASSERLGQVPLLAGEDGTWWIVVPAGDHVGWLEGPAGFARIEVGADADLVGEADEKTASLDAFAAAATVVGRLTDGLGTFRVRAEREEADGRWVGGAGFDVAPEPGLIYRMRVPPGRWRFSVVRTDMRTTEPRTLPLLLEAGTRFTGFDLSVR